MNDQRTGRVAIVADALGPIHGVPAALTQLCERGVPGYELHLIGADGSIEMLTTGRYDLIHVGAGGPAAAAALAIARAIDTPVLASFHNGPVTRVFEDCRLVLSAADSADTALALQGIDAERIARWAPGVDLGRFNPGRYAPDILPERFNVLYAGPLSHAHGVALLAEAFVTARERHPRLHLVFAGSGPEEAWLRRRLGASASFLGWIGSDHLAQVYASADLFVYPNGEDRFGQAVLEAQASGLPVIAVDGGGAAELIESGRNGCLVPSHPDAVAEAIAGLVRRAALRDRLVTGGLVAARARTWDRSAQQLAAGYALALDTEQAAGANSPLPGAIARAA